MRLRLVGSVGIWVVCEKGDVGDVGELVELVGVHVCGMLLVLGCVVFLVLSVWEWDRDVRSLGWPFVCSLV